MNELPLRLILSPSMYTHDNSHDLPVVMSIGSGCPIAKFLPIDKPPLTISNEVLLGLFQRLNTSPLPESIEGPLIDEMLTLSGSGWLYEYVVTESSPSITISLMPSGVSDRTMLEGLSMFITVSVGSTGTAGS